MPGFEKSRLVGVSEQDLEEFSCGICCEIFVKPVVTQCCRSTYCEECLNQWLTQHITCPNDRQPLTNDGLSPAPRIVINLLNNMKIKCDYYTNGCKTVVAINELSNHIKNCEFNTKKKCKTCGFTENGDINHNCIQTLKLMNENFGEEIERQRKELSDLKTNQEKLLGLRYSKDLENELMRIELNEIKKSYAKLLYEKNDISNRLNMSEVIKSARNQINNYVIENETKLSNKMSKHMKQICVEMSKQVVMSNDSYDSISRSLHHCFNNERERKRWHTMAFARDGGSTSIVGEEYICISFSELIIEIFSAGKV